jgi:hypothetical protein
MKNPCITTLRRGLPIAAVALLFAAASRPALGQAIYSTQFEPPSFVEGSLVGQDAWTAPPIFNPLAAIVSGDQPRQGKQSVQVRGADLEHSDLVNELTEGYYDTVGSYRRAVNVDTAGTARVRISARVRIDGPPTPGVNFFSAALSVRAAVVDAEGNIVDTAGAGQIDLSSDGYAHGNDGNHNVPVFLTSAPAAAGAWHDLAIIEDFAAKTFSLSVDGSSLGTFAFPEDINSTVLARGALLTFVAPDGAGLSKAGYAAYFDRFDVRLIGRSEGF